MPYYDICRSKQHMSFNVHRYRGICLHTGAGQTSPESLHRVLTDWEKLGKAATAGGGGYRQVSRPGRKMGAAG